MQPKKFFLLGEDPSSGTYLEINSSLALTELQSRVAEQFGIVEPGGVGFNSDSAPLQDVPDVLAFDGPVGVTVDGHRVREVPGPKGLPLVGDYYSVYPDHLGNHQRLFEQLGPVIQTNIMGKVVYQTNDPAIAAIVMTESPFFTKLINDDHPLASVKSNDAGVFVGDTDTPSWRIVHKFLPPALGPKAVRHYAPKMQKTIDDGLRVLDEFDARDEAINVYQFMLRASSEAIGDLVLGMSFNHLVSADAPLHEMVLLISTALTLNKKVSSRGTWYASLPFGDPQTLRAAKQRIEELMSESVAAATQNGIEDLSLQDAALEAANMVDYCIRATDPKGQKLPKDNMVPALIVATGAGFITTSSLLSWMIYALVTNEGVQDRLLQELVDNDFSEDLQITSEYTEKLTYMNYFIKEAQRKHNPSYQPGRTARRDLILPGGYKVPKDRVVIAAMHHLANNPKLWHDPARFDPDRWGRPETEKLPKGQFMPFAMGQRMCIGFNFALQEIKIFLPKLVWHCKWIKEGDSTVDYDPMFALIRPVNLYCRAVKRVKWPPKSE